MYAYIRDISSDVKNTNRKGCYRVVRIGFALVRGAVWDAVSEERLALTGAKRRKDSSLG